MTIEIVVNLVGVGSFAHGRQPLFAIIAVTAGNLERNNYTVTRLNFIDSWSDRFDDTIDFVAHNIALLHFDNDAPVRVKIAAADTCACDLENHILVVDNLWLERVHYFTVSTIFETNSAYSPT